MAMPFKFPSKFSKPGEAKPDPIDAPTVPTASEEAPAAEAPTIVVEAVAPEPAPAPSPELPRPSRLVEGERLKPTSRHGLGGLRDRLVAGGATSLAKPAAVAAALAVTLGLGYAMGSGRPGATQPAEAKLLSKLSADLATVKANLEAIKGERGAVRTDAKLVEKVERSGQDNATRIARLADQIERLDKAQRDPARSQAVLERIDRLEKGLQVAASAPPAPTNVAAAPSVPAPTTSAPASAPTPPPKPPAIAAEPTQTGSVPDTRSAKAEAKPDIDPRKTALDGYVLREVDDGYALIETRSGRFHEVSVGQVLPGIGKVEALERRGRQWVVVTAKGYIGERWN